MRFSSFLYFDFFFFLLCYLFDEIQKGGEVFRKLFMVCHLKLFGYVIFYWVLSFIKKGEIVSHLKLGFCFLNHSFAPTLWMFIFLIKTKAKSSISHSSNPNSHGIRIGCSLPFIIPNLVNCVLIFILLINRAANVWPDMITLLAFLKAHIEFFNMFWWKTKETNQLTYSSYYIWIILIIIII